MLSRTLGFDERGRNGPQNGSGRLLGPVSDIRVGDFLISMLSNRELFWTRVIPANARFFITAKVNNMAMVGAGIAACATAEKNARMWYPFTGS